MSCRDGFFLVIIDLGFECMPAKDGHSKQTAKDNDGDSYENWK